MKNLPNEQYSTDKKNVIIKEIFMCGISGIYNISSQIIPDLNKKLSVMNELLRHRGPDGEGVWSHSRQHIGLAHRRLSIIDIEGGKQPMNSENQLQITYNGEVYNYLELRSELGEKNFKTKSDTEVILKAYEKWGEDCVQRLRGMFTFAIWDEKEKKLFCARDRFGIKPFYYSQIEDNFYFASEAKALLPFQKNIAVDKDGLKDYLTFQFCLAGKTLFQGISELPPAHTLTIQNGKLNLKRYWQVYYNLDWEHDSPYFEEKIQSLLSDSIDLHLRSDVPLGAYISGGMDSSIVAALAHKKYSTPLIGFHGKFNMGAEYDESSYAKDLAKENQFELLEQNFTAQDFINNISKIIFHLDYPIAGPGSFPQFMTSQMAAQKRKVLLGGQGGDEIFGGYTRYLMAYFEQCIKAAIDGNMHSGNFIVTYESIIPNLTTLKNYKPLLKEFWKDGLFESMDKRYFRLINRARDLQDEIDWEVMEDYSAFQTFQSIFHSKNVDKESYFDAMTHFDFKTLLPALLHVEDRVSMAHGIESRVPFLDHPLVEFCATVPSNIKYQNGTMKLLLKKALGHVLPTSIQERKDKMGFPVPLTNWLGGELKDFVYDIFSSQKASQRDFIHNQKILKSIQNEPKYGRKIWGFLCLELWQREFHDNATHYQGLLET